MQKSIIGSTAAAALALLAAGCGGTSSRLPMASITNPGSAGQPHRLAPATASEAAAAAKAARCMRSHGIPNFPDPILGGHFGIDAASGIDPGTPQFKAAYLYCGTRYLHLHPPSPAELAQRNVAAVKYSHCMRAHGVSDFPDPDGQGAIELPTSDYFNTPKVQHALPACEALRTGEPFVLAVPVPWAHSQR